MPAWSPLFVTGDDGTSGRTLDHRGDGFTPRWSGRGSSDGAGGSPAGPRTAAEARTGAGGPTGGSRRPARLEIVFKVFRGWDKELGRGLMKVTQRMPGVGESAFGRGVHRMRRQSFVTTVVPLHQLSDRSDDQGDDNDRDLCDPHANDPSSVGAGVVDPLPLPWVGFEC